MVVTTVRPESARRFRKWMRLRAVVESRPVVGSSRKMIEGFISNSTPTDVRFFSPPERPLMRLLPT
jgi:hypothetical protein